MLKTNEMIATIDATRRIHVISNMTDVSHFSCHQWAHPLYGTFSSEFEVPQYPRNWRESKAANMDTKSFTNGVCLFSYGRSDHGEPSMCNNVRPAVVPRRCASNPTLCSSCSQKAGPENSAQQRFLANIRLRYDIRFGNFLRLVPKNFQHRPRLSKSRTFKMRKIGMDF